MSTWTDIKGLIGDAAPILGTLLGGPAGGAVGGLISAALGVKNNPNDVMAALQGNPALIEKLKEVEITQSSTLAQLQLQIDLAQAQANANEAQSNNWFIAAARPAIMWICAAIFAWDFLFEPILIFGLKVAGSAFNPAVLPAFDTATVMPVLLGLLGLGTMRTVEKVQGVNDQHG
jgi:hypothetical protein